MQGIQFLKVLASQLVCAARRYYTFVKNNSPDLSAFSADCTLRACQASHIVSAPGWHLYHHSLSIYYAYLGVYFSQFFLFPRNAPICQLHN
jgi:hypothetical protein